MPITKSEAQKLTRSFLRDYPSALRLAYKFRNNTIELYGPNASNVPSNIKGGYTSKSVVHDGRVYNGQIDVPLENIDDPDDLIKTLRHEVLGHFGLNTFRTDEKASVLNAIFKARNQTGLSEIWEKVGRAYANTPLTIQAEEVFSIHCETLSLSNHKTSNNIETIGNKSFRETCLEPTRLMQIEDLQNIACMVAQGLHDRTRTQQNFPHLDNTLERKVTASKKPTPKSNKAIYESIAEELIEQIKKGTAPWQKPWDSGRPILSRPTNPLTGDAYKGSNFILLTCRGYSDPRWMTYNQAQELGAQVRSGEKGTQCVRWVSVKDKSRIDEEKPILGKNEKPLKEELQAERKILIPKVFSVFNAEQIAGLPPLAPLEPPKWSPIERAEQILLASGATIANVEGDRAFYRPSTDSIQLPNKSQFSEASKYYATALHELGHWTGHESRLNRDLTGAFGSEGYAKEELRAEIASLMLGSEIGIGHDGGQHASYVASWVKVLKENPKEIFDAARDAEKINGYVLGLEKNLNQEIDVETLKDTFQEMTLRREILAFEYQDGSEEWESFPADLKALIEEHNNLPEALQKDFFDNAVSNPQTQKLIAQGINALELCEENDLSL